MTSVLPKVCQVIIFFILFKSSFHSRICKLSVFAAPLLITTNCWTLTAIKNRSASDTKVSNGFEIINTRQSIKQGLFQHAENMHSYLFHNTICFLLLLANQESYGF